ncbi:helix-turn-helix domain-containing protein [Neobacillus rhizophilus]|uniref:Helix-turn-helix domain-containing protein n=1 Tax=Neobacillus rhizophilus TaxID=2833579 RepID=A0A942YWZ5_9BACI|nr:helix-turn-helix domain-containing protein [Neobacillus rhizophilus]MBS4214560.1 helix-turn-helix domain-containing protein [Neobacillus rhizophilus]
MAEQKRDNKLGLLLKKLLKERSLSMRKLSELTGIDTATISRIINGKRKAQPEHLQKFADYLGVPISELFIAAGFAVEEKKEIQQSDITMSVESIQKLLEASNLIDSEFSIASVERQLANYEQYAQTEEGKESILKSFGEKLKKIGSLGPFISQLKDMFERFRLNKGTPRELAIAGSALIYFIVSVDVIPDYIFPVGYIDDAMAIQLVANLLTIKQ